MSTKTIQEIFVSVACNTFQNNLVKHNNQFKPNHQGWIKSYFHFIQSCGTLPQTTVYQTQGYQIKMMKELAIIAIQNNMFDLLIDIIHLLRQTIHNDIDDYRGILICICENGRVDVFDAVLNILQIDASENHNSLSFCYFEKHAAQCGSQSIHQYINTIIKESSKYYGSWHYLELSIDHGQKEMTQYLLKHVKRPVDLRMWTTICSSGDAQLMSSVEVQLDESEKQKYMFVGLCQGGHLNLIQSLINRCPLIINPFTLTMGFSKSCQKGHQRVLRFFFTHHLIKVVMSEITNVCSHHLLTYICKFGDLEMFKFIESEIPIILRHEYIRIACINCHFHVFVLLINLFRGKISWKEMFDHARLAWIEQTHQYAKQQITQNVFEQNARNAMSIMQLCCERGEFQLFVREWEFDRYELLPEWMNMNKELDAQTKQLFIVTQMNMCRLFIQRMTYICLLNTTAKLSASLIKQIILPFVSFGLVF